DARYERLSVLPLIACRVGGQQGSGGVVGQVVTARLRPGRLVPVRFNGVAECTRRRVPCPEDLDIDERASMGSPSSLGEELQSRRDGHRGGELQWGRRVHSAKSDSKKRMSRSAWQLQWGRRVQ